MRVKPSYESRLPGIFGAVAITIYPFVFIGMAKSEAFKWRVIQHECVHVRQVRNIGWLRFYASYVWQWAKSIATGKSRNEAYFAISYEQEAYDDENAVVLTDAERAEFGLDDGSTTQ